MIELHDSVITRLDVDGSAVVLGMNAYVHHSEGVPGVDAGTGWLHRAELRFGSGRVVPHRPELPVEIADGELHLGEDRVDNGIPVPLRFAGSVRLSLTLENGEAVAIEASEVALVMLEEDTYLEPFEADTPLFPPRTDVRYMTRTQLLTSAGQFLIAGLVMAVVVATIGYVGFGGGRTPRGLVVGLLFLFVVLAGMGCAGSLYLFLRGLARDRSYDPSAIRKADRERGVKRRP